MCFLKPFTGVIKARSVSQFLQAIVSTGQVCLAVYGNSLFERPEAWKADRVLPQERDGGELDKPEQSEKAAMGEGLRSSVDLGSVSKSRISLKGLKMQLRTRWRIWTDGSFPK